MECGWHNAEMNIEYKKIYDLENDRVIYDLTPESDTESDFEDLPFEGYNPVAAFAAAAAAVPAPDPRAWEGPVAKNKDRTGRKLPARIARKRAAKSQARGPGGRFQ